MVEAGFLIAPTEDILVALCFPPPRKHGSSIADHVLVTTSFQVVGLCVGTGLSWPEPPA
jgi:hypothetical protein